MSTFCRFFFVLAVVAPARCFPEEISRDQLINLLEGAGLQVSDLAFEYEGRVEYPRPSDRHLLHRDRFEGISHAYTGTFARRFDGATRVEIFLEDLRARIQSHSVTVTLGGKTESLSALAEQKRAIMRITPVSPQASATTGNYARIWMNAQVLALARTDLPYRFEGMQGVKGRSCVTVRFTYANPSDFPRGDPVSDAFWIDMERGGHVVRYERRLGNDIMEVADSIEVRMVEAPSGKKVWIPIFGRVEGHMTINPNVLGSPRVFTAQPVSVEDYGMIDGTLRLERRLDERYFSVRAKPGDFVSDELKQAQYEYGQYLVRSKNEKAQPISDVEIQQNLDKMLQESKFLERELKASSPARSGPGWADLLPWGAAGAAFVTLIVVLVRRHVDS